MQFLNIATKVSSKKSATTFGGFWSQRPQTETAKTETATNQNGHNSIMAVHDMFHMCNYIMVSIENFVM